MRIAYFTESYYPQPNGVATAVGYFVKSLRRKGTKVLLFAPEIKGYQDKEEDIHRLPSIRALPSLPDSVRLPLPIPHKNFLNMIRLNFDLVHAHGGGIFSFLGLLVARNKKVPYVLTFHTQISQFSHYFLKGKVVKGKLLNNILLKRFGNLCDGIITPSEKMKQELIESGVKKHIKVIPNFVDLNRFEVKNIHYLHKKYKIPQASPILLAVGRIGKEKNFEFLIRVFQQVTKYDPHTCLVIVGEGLGEKEFKKYIIKLRLKERVCLTGRIPYEKMPYVYKDADIFVFPSVSEVHPMVAIEAAASSLPLIVAQDQAYKGIVIHNKNGFILPLDEQVFVKSIIKLLNNYKLRQKFAQNSPEVVKKNFDPDGIIQKVIRYYKQTLKTYEAKPKKLRLSRLKAVLSSFGKNRPLNFI